MVWRQNYIRISLRTNKGHPKKLFMPQRGIKYQGYQLTQKEGRKKSVPAYNQSVHL